MTALPPEPPDETALPPPEPPRAVDAEGVICPRCGTEAEPFQEYCLECGLRLPVRTGVIAVLSTAWQRRLPWYPGDWIWPVLLGLLIAALGATAAILYTRDDDSSATKIPVHTGPATLPGTGEETTGTETGGEPPTETDTTPAEPPPPPAPPAAPAGATEWPAGQDGWTIVLASLPESSGRASAQSAARKAAGEGLSDVGVLNSSDYSSLHPGYWVVFSGIYDSLAEARGNLETARASYPQAYTRQITQ